jgi:hypothetical protein
MKNYMLAALCVFFFGGLAGLPAQSGGAGDLGAAIQGVLFAAGFAENSRRESGATPGASFRWKQTGEYSENFKLYFGDFRYALWNDTGRLQSLTISGEIELSGGILNGSLKVLGNAPLSVVGFYDFDADDMESGRITVDGLNCPPEELAEIFDGISQESPVVVPWEMEAVIVCAYAFMSGGEQLEWDGGESVLGTLFEREGRPASGSSVSNPENTLSAVCRQEGIGFIYKKFPVVLPGDIPLAVVTGEVFFRLEEGAARTIFFDGEAVFEGLPGISLMRFRQCLLTSEFPDGNIGGSVFVDGQELLFSDIVSFMETAF